MKTKIEHKHKHILDLDHSVQNIDFSSEQSKSGEMENLM